MRYRAAPHLSVAAVMLALLAGCAPTPPTHAGSVLTWQEAKQEAQQTEDDIVALIPADNVVAVEQRPTGTLFSCGETQHQWAGGTTVTLAPGTDIEALVQLVSDHYQDTGEFTPREYLNINDELTVQLLADAAASYIVNNATRSSDNVPRIDISSFSACFTLPEDVYPGGDF